MKEKKKTIIKIISLIFVISAVMLQIVNYLKKEQTYNLSFEYINIKDMAATKVSNKKETSKLSLIDSVFTGSTNAEVEEVSLPNSQGFQEVKFTGVRKIENTPTVPKRIWYLPTEIGTVTQNPHYGHVALDITSPRGTGELIFPVANGTISSIYRDSAGALIVTVLHNINGKKYTSQYVHLSSYANGLYVGKPVTINDCLGRMGSTGYSTGVHLHLAVLDCALFDPNDNNCRDLNGFFRYANYRLGQGYIGLGTMLWVPGSWTKR